MKKTSAILAGGFAGAVAIGLMAVAPAQAAPLTANQAIHSTADASSLVTQVHHRNHRRRGHDYYGNWRQSRWHQRHYNQHRNYNYGPRYRHNNYGNVRPFKHFLRVLSGHGYYNFSRPRFHGHGRHWTPHYYVSAYDGYGRGVNLRVCAYTGNVLGWRYY